MEYMTIAEYAEQAHISKQSAYKRAKSEKYKRYFHRNKSGVLVVETAALNFNQNFNHVETVENVETTEFSQSSLNQNSTNCSTAENALFNLLKEQLEKQTEQIENLYKMINEKDIIIKDLSANMAKITAQFQALQHEQHLLEAGKAETENNKPIERKESIEPLKKGLFARFRKH